MAVLLASGILAGNDFKNPMTVLVHKFTRHEAQIIFEF